MTMTNLPSHAFQVRVIDQVNEVDDQEFVNSVLEQFQTKILEHLQQAPEYFKSADLEIKLTKCTARHFPNEIRWDIWTETTGTINDTEIRISALSQGDEFVFREALNTNIVSVASHLATDVKNLMSTDYDHEKDYIHKGSHRCVKNAIFDVMQKILGSIDNHVDRQPSEYSIRWRRIQKSRWFVAAFTFLVTTISSTLIDQFFHKWAKNQDELLERSIFLSIYLTGAAFILVHCWGYLIMPKQFFLVETAGKRALKNAGTSSIVILKLVVLILMGIILFGLVFLGHLIVSGD